ncbi:Uma2 family endonuclease [Scytonema sp. UIC 10036]|uniref:Uma2 family endonuclease n=1 Tax=Scytonema sp. UIC 10036 TaxID=2304196 RepID=UPI0012DAC81C|nr:Uma2 family endonuclease [Scytonema sp. UIC 10036]MUG91346.1 Uma2 family endonuclease [Scytonema sp. UIC 10036]
MTQAQPLQRLFTYDEFIEWYPNDGKNYELHKGVIFEMPPASGSHTEVIGFLVIALIEAIKLQQLSYRTSESTLVKINSSTTYKPDLIVINRENLINEPLWEKESTLSCPDSIPLVVEIVSTNWQDDYDGKFNDYAAMGIREYWIVDYKALGGRRYIGNPKQRTIFVCELIDGEYQMNPFRGSDRIVSPTFPQLNLTAQQIFDSVA